MVLVMDLAIILVSSIAIYLTGSKFAESSSKIGDYYGMPRSVKGATLDAVSSSLPELMIALISVIFFGKFEVGIGTIAGSALFNLLIIPAICVLVSPVLFKVSRDVISRDALFYIMAVFALLASLLYSNIWAIIIPLAFILIYIWYLKVVIKYSLRYKRHFDKENKKIEISISKEFIHALTNLIIMGIAAFFLTESAIQFSESLGIPPIIIGFTIIAAATSLPDTVISVVNAKKGDVTSATSNVFGSNIFDILIGLSIPVLIMFFISGPTTIIFEQIEIVLGLLGATILVLYFLARSQTLKKKEAWIMLLMYATFIAYTIYLAFK